MPRFGAEHGARSIRQSPLYNPYYKAIRHVAGFADAPAGSLKEASVIGRGRLFDALNDFPRCGRILDGRKLPTLTACESRNAGFSREMKGALVVVGTVMGDLGYHRFSNHAWSRVPVGGE